MQSLLDLAQETNKCKTLEKELTKEEVINQILAKLRQRNLLNDNFIKKYIKQISKKRSKLKLRDLQNSNRVSHQQNVKEPRPVQYFRQCSKSILRTETTENSLKLQEKTQNSLILRQAEKIEQALQDNSRINSLPKISYSSTPGHQASHQKKVKNHFENINIQRQLNKFYKQSYLKQRVQTVKLLGEINDKNICRSESENKMKSEGLGDRYQLSIKSLIFGSEVILTQQKSSKDFPLNSNLSINQAILKCKKNMKKYEKQSQFYDDKVKKGALPNINSNYNKQSNHYFLDNFIQNNQEKTPNHNIKIKTQSVNKQIQYKWIKQNRKQTGFRINALKIHKHF